MRLIIHIGENCKKEKTCICHELDEHILKKIPRIEPPFHPGCDCYVYEEGNEESMQRMSGSS